MFSHLAQTQGAGATPYVLMAKIQLAKKTVAHAHAKRTGQQTPSYQVYTIDSSNSSTPIHIVEAKDGPQTTMTSTKCDKVGCLCGSLKRHFYSFTADIGYNVSLAIGCKNFFNIPYLY